ncbi:hypothetical protein Ahy_A06g028029 [Arachis hypogaea]|uniref:Protein FAR1-RELATED SEQUENCE n=1 Tax=Arachis hypogaea TaxID=3818 RepID=A0A445CQC3_ARAHY|nr:hypothetical protein Ahy_A06g028029 [Arachis hypogaea]
MKEKNQNFFFELNFQVDHSIKNAFLADAKNKDCVRHVYTHEKFRKVQIQFRGKVNCIARSTQSAIGFMAYKVVELVSNSTFNKFVVTYNSISREVKCQCFFFELRGILCHHSLSALSFERIDKVAPKYILECWSKNIKRRLMHINSSQDEPLLERRSKKFDYLVFRLHNICEFVSKSEDLTGIIHRKKMQEYQAKSKGKCSLSHGDTTLNDINNIQSPPRVRTRGRPKNRLGSNLEKRIASASKKKEKPALSDVTLICFRIGGNVFVHLNLLDGRSKIQ